MYNLEARVLVTPATDQEPGMKVKPFLFKISIFHCASSAWFGLLLPLQNQGDFFNRNQLPPQFS